MAIAFLIWYFAYVLLSTFAVDFMSIKVFGRVNLGIVLGLLQTALETSVKLGDPAWNIAIFAIFVVATLTIVIRVSQGGKKKASNFYTGGAQFDGRQNGLAIAGDYLSAASFLGIVGAIALSGYDGLLYSIGLLVAWLVALLLVAEPLRNTGRYTMADVLSFRVKERPVRMAAAISTLVISFFYLLAQMAGAGGLVSLLLGVKTPWMQDLVIVVVGLLMIGGIAAKSQNIAFLVSLAFAVAASANLPSILYSLYWKRFNTQGSLWSIHGGLASALVLIIFSPAVSGVPTAMFPNADLAWFPLGNPAIVSVPLGFFLGWLGSVLSKEVPDLDKAAEMEVRSMTGAGAAGRSITDRR